MNDLHNGHGRLTPNMYTPLQYFQRIDSVRNLNYLKLLLLLEANLLGC
jgi:hypothetical protein